MQTFENENDPNAQPETRLRSYSQENIANNE